MFYKYSPDITEKEKEYVTSRTISPFGISPSVVDIVKKCKKAEEEREKMEARAEKLTDEYRTFINGF